LVDNTRLGYRPAQQASRDRWEWMRRPGDWHCTGRAGGCHGLRQEQLWASQRALGGTGAAPKTEVRHPVRQRLPRASRWMPLWQAGHHLGKAQPEPVKACPLRKRVGRWAEQWGLEW